MDSNLRILQRAEEKRKKKNEIMKRMRERRGDELKEKQKEYRKIHIEKMKKKTEIDVSAKTAKEYLVDVPINRVLIKKDKGILISRAEKIGVKGVRDKTAVDYINKISIIHKILSKNELDKELLKRILIGKENEGNETNECNEYDVENLIKNMEYIYDVDKIIIAIYTKYTNVYSRKCHIASFMTLISYLPPNINKNGVVSYEIIRKKFEELQEEIYEERGKNRKAINEESIDNFEEEEIMRNYANLNIDEGLIYVFYTLQPPRRVEDVQLITLIKLKDKDCCEDTSDTNDIYDKLDNDKNYIIVDSDNNPREIVYNKYKTDHIYGRQIITIVNNNLKNIIRTYILAHFLEDCDKLFIKYKNPSSFCEAIKRIFSKIYNKKITLNNIRHSYITCTMRTAHNANFLKNLALLMGHSTNEQLLYKRLE
jgi:hypothetical protein